MSHTHTHQNGLKAVQTVRRLLLDIGLTPIEKRAVDRTLFLVAFDGPAKEGIAEVLDSAERFVFYFVFDGSVPEARRSSVAEFVVRANWHLIEGNFQLDPDSGALRYKIGLDFSNTELTEPLVRNAILSAMDTIEMFVAGLMAVITGELSPKDACKAALSKRLE